MECKRKLFRIPYRQLLEDITKSLGWARPVYNGSSDLGGVASVVVRPKDEGPLAYFFEGQSNHPLAAPEDLAAEHAVLFLMENKRVLVLDFNFRKRGKNESCVGYYRDKKNRLSVPPRKRKLPTAGDYEGVAAVDFRPVLDDVLREFQIPVTAVKCVELSVARNVAFFGIQQASLKIEWVVSNCSSTEILARQSLAKKALKYLQPFLGFEIEDLSYHGMRMAALQCSLERENYLTVKERNTGVMEEGGSATLAIVDGCRTPVHEEAMIRIPNSPPPPPKKKKENHAVSEERPHRCLCERLPL